MRSTPPPDRPARRVVPERPTVVPVALWNRMFAEPAAVAGHIARAAVEEAGTVARDWAAAGRAKYPAAPPITNAHAAQVHVRHQFLYAGPVRARGALTPADAVTEWSELAWYQALLVLYVAAAVGLDPLDPQRTRDLLTLWRAPGSVPDGQDAPEPTEDRLREVTPQLAMTLGRLTGLRAKKVTEFVPDPTWYYVADDEARTLRPLWKRAVRLLMPTSGSGSSGTSTPAPPATPSP